MKKKTTPDAKFVTSKPVDTPVGELGHHFTRGAGWDRQSGGKIADKKQVMHRIGFPRLALVSIDQIRDLVKVKKEIRSEGGFFPTESPFRASALNESTKKFAVLVVGEQSEVKVTAPSPTPTVP